MHMLRDKPHEKMEWKLYPNMVRIRTIGDGSCFFHALLSAYYIPYKNDKVNKNEYVKQWRHELADTLDKPIVAGGITWYESLSRGQLASLSKTHPRCALENMKRELDSTAHVDNLYNEFVSNIINKDIYVLNGEKKDVYYMGDEKLLYKNRDSIVLLYIPGHYELVGVISDRSILPLFQHNHPFIMAIRARMQQLRPVPS